MLEFILNHPKEIGFILGVLVVTLSFFLTYLKSKNLEEVLFYKTAPRGSVEAWMKEQSDEER